MMEKIIEKLAEANVEENDQNTKWLSLDEIFTNIREKHEMDILEHLE